MQDVCIIHLGICSSCKTIPKKAIKILKKIGFTGGNVNPCLYVKMSKKVIVYVELYLMIGDIGDNYDAITALMEYVLVLKVVEGVQDCLSCGVNFSIKKRRKLLGQPHFIKNLEKKSS